MSKIRYQSVDHETVFEVVPSLIEFEALLFLLWSSDGWYAMVVMVVF